MLTYSRIGNKHMNQNLRMIRSCRKNCTTRNKGLKKKECNHAELGGKECYGTSGARHTKTKEYVEWSIWEVRHITQLVIVP